MIVEKLFYALPVRRQMLESKSNATKQLKEIETFLKGVAIANPKCHLSLYNDSDRVFTKGAVQSTSQAIVAVLGPSIGKRVEQCGPVTVNIHNEKENQDENLNEESKSTTIELYLPKQPVDMRTMSFTSNKLAMIFCNRKRVYITEYEKVCFD